MGRSIPDRQGLYNSVAWRKKDANRVRAIIDNLIYADREDGLAVMYGEMMGERLATLMNNILPIDWDVDDDDDEWDDDDDEYDDLSYDDINWENIDWDDLIFGDYCGNEYEEGQITVDDVMPNIERVIFNNPATIVYWDDGTKTVVKCQDGDTYSQETGLAMAIAKKVFGNNSSYNEVFKQWVEQGSK